MSVLIKGMEMPKTCDDCILLRHYRFLGEPILCCEPNDRELIEVEEYEKDKKRLSDCPLVEVPVPHGDLIDRQKLIEDNKHLEYPTDGKYRSDRAWAVGFNAGARHCNEHAVYAKPVIEAERKVSE